MEVYLFAFSAWQLSAEHVERTNWTLERDAWTDDIHFTVHSDGSIWKIPGNDETLPLPLQHEHLYNLYTSLICLFGFCILLLFRAVCHTLAHLRKCLISFWQVFDIFWHRSNGFHFNWPMGFKNWRRLLDWLVTWKGSSQKVVKSHKKLSNGNGVTQSQVEGIYLNSDIAAPCFVASVWHMIYPLVYHLWLHVTVIYFCYRSWEFLSPLKAQWTSLCTVLTGWLTRLTFTSSTWYVFVELCFH